VGRDRRWLSRSPAIINAVLGGWEFSGITSMRTGLPVTIVTSQQLSGGINNRAHQVCHGVPIIGRIHKWFDTKRFAIASFPVGAEVLGNSGRGAVSGPGLTNLDVSHDNTFRLGERHTLEFNASAFNALNSPHLIVQTTT
jgi:hypothetical protein